MVIFLCARNRTRHSPGGAHWSFLAFALSLFPTGAGTLCLGHIAKGETMSWKGHLLVILLILGLLYHFGVSLSWMVIGFAVFGALFPDIDSPQSLIRKLYLFALLGLAFFQNSLTTAAVLIGAGLLPLLFLKHRGVMHNPLFLAALSVVLYWFVGQEQALGFVIGWISHLIADHV